jgi:hypothetical protein
MKTIFLQAFVAIFTLSITVSVKAQKKRAAYKKTQTLSKASSDMLSMLQGRWSSLDDKKTFFHIEGNQQIDIYGRDILDTATVNFYDECPNRINAGDEKRKSGRYLTVQLKPDDFYCYSVEKISSQQLVLMYLPKGSILRYKKVPTKKLDNNNPLEEKED